MKILSVDTATEACSAALLVDGEVLERFRIAPRQHTRLILPMVDSLLDEAGVRLQDLDTLALGRGPGLLQDCALPQALFRVWHWEPICPW